jgi:DNA-binding response OmpR family regulator
MKKRILVVDDEPDILYTLKEIFERENYEVFTVESGIECIKKLEKNFRGVVLIDIMMPHMDGWDTVREIVKRGLAKHIIIGIITGKGTMDHQKISGLESYIHDYFTKPFNIQKLVSSVNKCTLSLSPY